MLVGALTLLGCEPSRTSGGGADAGADALPAEAAAPRPDATAAAYSGGDYLAPDEPWDFRYTDKDRVDAPACQWEIVVDYPDHETKTFSPASAPLPLRSKSWRCVMSNVTKSGVNDEMVELRCMLGRHGGVVRSAARWVKGTYVSNASIELIDATTPPASHQLTIRCRAR